MLVKNWMSKKVISLTPDRSMMKASKVMKDNDIHRIPIVDENGRLMGIVSDRDVKEASPSKATTLDMHELYYLLSEIKLKDIMTKNPLTVKDTDTVEKAAVIMHREQVGGLPVLDESGLVVGIITDADVFKVLIQITGVLHGGVQFAVKLSNQPGALQGVLDSLKDYGARIMSVLTAFDPEDESDRHVFIRIQEMEKAKLAQVQDGLNANYELVYWTRDPVDALIS